MTLVDTTLGLLMFMSEAEGLPVGMAALTTDILFPPGLGLSWVSVVLLGIMADTTVSFLVLLLLPGLSWVYG